MARPAHLSTAHMARPARSACAWLLPSSTCPVAMLSGQHRFLTASGVMTYMPMLYGYCTCSSTATAKQLPFQQTMAAQVSTCTKHECLHALHYITGRDSATEADLCCQLLQWQHTWVRWHLEYS